MRFRPPWAFIDDFRRFVEVFCRCAHVDAGREQQVALAAHELLQNAVTLTLDGEAEVLLSVSRRDNRVSVAVTDRSAPEEIKKLEALIAHLASEADALNAYLGQMSATDTRPGRRAGLGLARIRFEAQLELRVEVKDGRVTVEAYGPIAPGEEPR